MRDFQMFQKLSAQVIEAAGGIVERNTSEGLRIAIIYRKRYGGEWGLPKGKRQAGESWQNTALRDLAQQAVGADPAAAPVGNPWVHRCRIRPGAARSSEVRRQSRRRSTEHPG